MLLDIADRTQPKVIIEELIPTEGRQVPTPFKVPLAPGCIDRRHSYSVKAEILIAGKAWFITKKAIPVLTGGNPCEVDIVLERSWCTAGQKPGSACDCILGSPNPVVGIVIQRPDVG